MLKKVDSKPKNIVSNREKQNNGYRKNKGITLVALVITIIIIIILSTVAISFLFGENGLITRAQQAKLEQEIATARETLTMILGEAFIEKKINPEYDQNEFLDNFIKEREPNVYLEEDEIGLDGHVFSLDRSVPELGKYIGEQTGPRIKEIKVTGETTNSVSIEVLTVNATGAEYTYLYKKESEGEESWQEVETSNNNTCTIGGLQQGEIYNIKVVVTTKDGSAEGIINVYLGEIPTETITFTNLNWVGDGTASVQINTTAEGYTLQYQINSTEGSWTNATNGEIIEGLTYPSTVYGRLWDGTNESDYATLSLEDKKAPEVNVTGTGTTSNSVSVSVAATDNESGMVASPTYTYSIKQSGQDDSSYTTSGNASNLTTNTYTFTGLTQGTSYDVKVEVNGDKAGNKGIGTLTNETTGSIPGGETGVEQGAITFGNVQWNNTNGQASVTVSTKTSYTIEYQVGSISEGDWTTISSGGTISGLSHGQTVYARLTDGINAGEEASVSIEDNTPPTISNITTSVTENSITVNVTASDSESGIATYTYALTGGETASNATGSYTFAGLNSSTPYTIQVTVTDRAGQTATESTEVTTDNPTLPDGWDGDKVKSEESTDGVTVPVPIGYIASDATGEASVNDGFVIYEGIDEVNDSNVNTAKTTRNQFVWIPVPDISQIANQTSGTDKNGRQNYQGKLYDFSLTGATEKTSYGQGTTSYREPDILTDYDGSSTYLSILGLSSSSELKTQLQEEFNEMIASVDTYGGFYIGRYETGNLASNTTTEPVVVKGNEDISNVNWYYMYQNSKKVVANNNVVSTMIWGCMWDRALIWLTETGDKTYSEITNSTTWGNYGDSEGAAATNSGSKQPTGTNEAWQANNIYDLAGNVYDWTIEATGTYNRVLRGGVYNGSGSADPSSSRLNNYPSSTGSHCGARLAFYVNL